jgi:hypothetical protein
VDGDATVVLADVGSDRGVRRDWEAHVVDADGNTLEHGACKIVRVDKRLLLCKTKLVPDQFPSKPFVRVRPPP